MKFLVVRHGESESNLQRIVAGQRVDKSLTVKGRRQAQETAKGLKGRTIGRIVSSHLKRAHETAEIIAQFLGLEVEILPDLAEVDYGEISGLSEDKTQRNMERSFAAKAGELPKDLEERAMRVIKKLEFWSSGETDILLVGHKTFNAILFAVWEGVPKESFIVYRSQWHMDNAEVKELK